MATDRNERMQDRDSITLYGSSHSCRNSIPAHEYHTFKMVRYARMITFSVQLSQIVATWNETIRNGESVLLTQGSQYYRKPISTNGNYLSDNAELNRASFVCVFELGPC